MEKKIVETKASYPGVPRVDFLYPDFDALVDNKGYEVIWERAIPCPCSKRVQHQSTCRNCGGSGWVFINPTRIKAVCQSLNKNTRYKDWSVEMLGTAAITVKSMFHLNFMDKITIENSISPRSEVLIAREWNGQLYAFTIYPILEVTDVFLFLGTSEPLRLLQKGIDYTFELNRIVFFPSSCVREGSSVSVTYEHKVQYNIIDLNHDIRNTFILDNKSRENNTNMPIAAIMRRVHNVIDAPNLTDDNLVNNSYLP